MHSLSIRTVVLLCLLATAAGCVAPHAGCALASAGGRKPIPPGARWTYQPTAVSSFARSVPLASEQVHLLENRTAYPGDNTLRMLARHEAAGHTPPFSPQELFACVGGPPAPFTAEDLDGVIIGEDASGPVMWAQAQVGPGALCVLGLRRLTADRNLTPPGVAVVDVVLRNCVEGDLEDAMAPLRPGRIAVGPGTRPPDAAASPSPRLLSPLAGPRPGVSPP